MKEAPFCTLFFCEILVKFHQDAGCLGADGGACRVNGAVVVAVNQLVAVGPAHGGFRPVGHAATVRELGKVALRT